MRSIECSSQGVWVAEVPPCVWLNEMMAKSFWRHYAINNLTQDYRKEKEESKETMALEVEEWQNWKEWLGICTQQENTGRDMCFGLCVAFFLY